MPGFCPANCSYKLRRGSYLHVQSTVEFAPLTENYEQVLQPLQSLVFVLLFLVLDPVPTHREIIDRVGPRTYTVSSCIKMD